MLRSGPFSREAAERWPASIEEFEANAKGARGEVKPQDVLLDMIETEQAKPKGRRQVSNKELERVAAVALKNEHLLRDLLPQYLQERGPEAERRRGWKPLAPSTQRTTNEAVAAVLRHFGENATLVEIDAEKARIHRQEFLPSQTSPRSPDGLSDKTIQKHCSLLLNMWKWARETGLTPAQHPSPWEREKGVPRASRKLSGRSNYSAEEVGRLLNAVPPGDRMGDAMRLALLTGCRADELGQVKWSDFDDDFGGFMVQDGKTPNARRWIPLPSVLSVLVDRRRKRTEGRGDHRLLWDWPIRPSTGVCAALPQAFTRFRRRVLGCETDGKLTFHSFRHTWRTEAARARVAPDVIRQIGGWSDERNSASEVYNHGLKREQLAEAQELIADWMRSEGFLEAF